MRTPRFVKLMPLVVVIAASCSTMKLSTDCDRKVDFSGYATFSVAPGAEFRKYLLRERLEEAVIAALAAKGLKHVDTDADLLIALHGRVDTETKIVDSSFGYTWGGWGYWGAPYRYGVPMGTTTSRQVPVGTLVVDVVDARDKKLIWQAVASDTINPQASGDTKVNRINSALERIFKGFPPKAR